MGRGTVGLECVKIPPFPKVFEFMSAFLVMYSLFIAALAASSYYTSVETSIDQLTSVGFDVHAFQGYNPLLLWVSGAWSLLLVAVFCCGWSQVHVNACVFKGVSMLLMVTSAVLVVVFLVELTDRLWISRIVDGIADQARTIERFNDNYCRAACQGSDTSAAVLLRELKGCGADPQLGFNRVVTFESPLSPWCLQKLNHNELIATRGKQSETTTRTTPFEELGHSRDLPSLGSIWFFVVLSIAFYIAIVTVISDADNGARDQYMRLP